MQYHFFHIRAIDPEPETERLNQFLYQHSIHSIDRQFVENAENSYWSICVVTHRPQQNTPDVNKQKKQKQAGKKEKIDYQQVLDPERFTLYTKLRGCRNQIGQERDVVPYAVFTNEQLAQITQLESINLESLSTIKPESVTS